MSRSISLRAFGYNMTSSDEARYVALQKAIDAHGLEKVIARLNQIKVNVQHLKQTEKDILYVLSKVQLPEDEDEDEPTIVKHSVPDDKYENEPTIVKHSVPEHDNKNDQFIKCMELLNSKLCKATLEKDYAMIDLMVTSMTNVVKSTL